MRLRKLSWCILLVAAHQICLTIASPVQAKGYESTRTFQSSSNTFGSKTDSKPATVTQTGHFSEVISTNGHIQSQTGKPLTQIQVTSNHEDALALDQKLDHSSDEEVFGLLPAEPSLQTSSNYGSRIQTQDSNGGCSIQGGCDTSVSSHTGESHDSSNNQQFPVQQHQDQEQYTNQQFPIEQTEQVNSANRDFSVQQNRGQGQVQKDQGPTQQTDEIDQLVDELDHDIRNTFGDGLVDSIDQYANSFEDAGPRSSDNADPEVSIVSRPNFPAEEVDFQAERLPVTTSPEGDGALRGDDGQYDFPDQQNPDFFGYREPETRSDPDQPSGGFFDQPAGPQQGDPFGDSAVDQFDQFRGDPGAGTQGGFQSFVPGRTINNNKGTYYMGEGREQFYQNRDPIEVLRYNVPGTPGDDYPILYQVPETSFDCNQQPFSSGIYGDTDAQCQVFHFCRENGIKDSFLCPNGTVFNQQYFVCDWWYNYKCSDTPSFYNLNAQLYMDSVAPSQILGGTGINDQPNNFENGFQEQDFREVTPNTRFPQEVSDGRPNQSFGGVRENVVFPQGGGSPGTQQAVGNRVVSGQTLDEKRVESNSGGSRTSTSSTSSGRTSFTFQGTGSHGGNNGQVPSSHQQGGDESQYPVQHFNQPTATQTTGFQKPIEQTNRQPVPQSTGSQIPVRQTNQRRVSQPTGLQKPVEQNNQRTVFQITESQRPRQQNNQRTVTQTTGFQKPVQQTNFNQRTVTQTQDFSRPVENSEFNQRAVSQVIESQKTEEPTRSQQDIASQLPGQEQISYVDDIPNTQDFQTTFEDSFNQASIENVRDEKTNIPTDDVYRNVNSEKKVHTPLPGDSTFVQSHDNKDASHEQSFFQQQQVGDELPSVSAQDGSVTFDSNVESPRDFSTAFQSNRYNQDFSQVSDTPFDIQQQNVDFSLNEGSLSPNQDFITANDFGETKPTGFDTQYLDNQQQVNIDTALENQFFQNQGFSDGPFEVTSLVDGQNSFQKDLSVDEKPLVSDSVSFDKQAEEKLSQENVDIQEFKDTQIDAGSQGIGSISSKPTNTNLPTQEEFDVSNISRDQVDISNVDDAFNSRNVAFQETPSSPEKVKQENVPISSVPDIQVQTTDESKADVEQKNVEDSSFAQKDVKSTDVRDARQDISIFQQQNIPVDDIFHMMRGLPGISTQQRFFNRQQPNTRQSFLSFRPYGQNTSPALTNINQNNQFTGNSNAQNYENHYFSQTIQENNNPNPGHLNFRPYGQNTSPQVVQNNAGHTEVGINNKPDSHVNQNIPQHQPQQNVENVIFPETKTVEERRSNVWQNTNSQGFTNQPVQTLIEQHERRVKPNDQAQFLNTQSNNGLPIQDNQNIHAISTQNVQDQIQQNTNGGHNNQNRFVADNRQPQFQGQVNSNQAKEQVFQPNSEVNEFNPHTHPQNQQFVLNQNQVQGGFQHQFQDGRQPINGNFHHNFNSQLNGGRVPQERNIEQFGDNPNHSQNNQFAGNSFSQEQIIQQSIPERPISQENVPIVQLGQNNVHYNSRSVEQDVRFSSGQAVGPFHPTPRDLSGGQFENRPTGNNNAQSNFRVKGNQGNLREARFTQHFGQLSEQPHTQRIEASDVRVYSQNDPMSAASVVSYNGWRPIVRQ